MIMLYGQCDCQLHYICHCYACDVWTGIVLLLDLISVALLQWWNQARSSLLFIVDTWVEQYWKWATWADVMSVPHRWWKLRNFLDGNHHVRIRVLTLSFQHEWLTTQIRCYTPWMNDILSLYGQNNSFIGCS